MINKKILLSLLFLAAIAMCAGAFFEVFMEGIGKEQLMSLLSIQFSEEISSSFLTILSSSFLSLFKVWLFLCLSPIIPILFFMAPMICFFKGLSLGFSSTMLVETFGFKGTIYILSTIMPQNVIQLPILCILSTLSLEMSFYLFKYFTQKNNRKRNKNVLQTFVRHYLSIFICSLLILFISCIVEACLKQFLL